MLGFVNDYYYIIIRCDIKCLMSISGLHIFQNMYGCEWDDQTGAVKVYDQYGYDGEDFISLDMKTKAWIAPKSQAVITKNNWDNNKAWITQDINYLTEICIDWLKKYVNYGKRSLLRTGTVSCLYELLGQIYSQHWHYTTYNLRHISLYFALHLSTSVFTYLFLSWSSFLTLPSFFFSSVCFCYVLYTIYAVLKWVKRLIKMEYIKQQ